MSDKHFILFLDFDGVICTLRQAVAEGDYGSLGCLDPIAMKFLDRMCLEYPVKVVISSSWRIGRDYLHFNSLFKAAGCFHLAKSLHYDDFKTPILSGIRGLEIEDWLKRNDSIVKDYLILDDDKDMIDYQMSRLINTPFEDGLQFRHYTKIEKAISETFDMELIK